MKYENRRIMTKKANKPYESLTDEKVSEICTKVAQGLDTQTACNRLRVSYKTFEDYTTGSDPRRPDWAADIACARAECVEYLWACMMQRDIESGEAKAKHHLLMALDARFRQDKSVLQPIIVQVMDPTQVVTGLPVISMREGAQKQLPEHIVGADPPGEA